LTLRGTRAPAATSPPTLTLSLTGRVTLTSACGWIALPSSAFSIVAWTARVVWPATAIRPA
jgi:hypothetical protein